MAKKVFGWIEDRLRRMDPPVPMSEIARRWGLTNGAVVTRYIKYGPKERAHLNAKWTAILADILEWPAEVVIGHIRPAERAFREEKGFDRDIMAETPAEIVQATARLMKADYLETYRRLETAVNAIVEKEALL